ncbi:MAG: hypothetical protein NTZ28_01825 [Nitrospirae bacterium]|nr:hypothetical protein [Nitrospirota bacterium]
MKRRLDILTMVFTQTTKNLDDDLASLSCSFGLFGLSGLFGCMRLTRWTRQTGLVPDVRTSEVLACDIVFPQPAGAPAANDEVPTINHPANARKNTSLMATLLSTST